MRREESGLPVCVRCGSELTPPFAFCAKCGSPQPGAAAPYSPWPGAYAAAPPFYPYRKPPSSRHLLILVAALIALMVVTPLVVFYFTSGLMTSYPAKPFVTFTSATVTAASVSFSVSSATPVVSYASYKFNLQRNGMWGVAASLTAGNHTIAVAGVVFYVYYTDTAGNGNLKTGDTVRVGLSAGGNLPAGAYTFALLWAGDGSIVASLPWTV